jgi:hypothetical protein
MGGRASRSKGSGVVSAHQKPKKMVTESLAKSLTKQGYKLVGSHSGVKLCRCVYAIMLIYEYVMCVCIYIHTYIYKHIYIPICMCVLYCIYMARPKERARQNLANGLLTCRGRKWLVLWCVSHTYILK